MNFNYTSEPSHSDSITRPTFGNSMIDESQRVSASPNQYYPSQDFISISKLPYYSQNRSESETNSYSSNQSEGFESNTSSPFEPSQPYNGESYNYNLYNSTSTSPIPPRCLLPFEDRLPKRRQRTSAYQLSVLETNYRISPRPPIWVREEIAKKVGMKEKAVNVWFQNRRQATKKNQTRQGNVDEYLEIPDCFPTGSASPLLAHHPLRPRPQSSASYSPLPVFANSTPLPPPPPPQLPLESSYSPKPI